jgi:hypothetical protein
MRRTLLVTAALGFVLAATPCARADAESEARAIIDKAVKAHGGADNLAKFKAGIVKMKGKVEVAGMAIEFTTTASVQMPDKMQVETNIDFMGNKVTFLQILNGDKGWIKFADKVMEMDKDQVAEAAEQFHAMRVASLAALSDKAFKLSPMGETKVNGKNAVGVQVSHKDRRDVNLFFDKETGLMVKAETRSKDLFGGNDQEFTAETFYSEYKDFNGIKRPTKQILKRDGKDFGQFEITDFETKDKLDDSLFAKPQ